VLIPPPAREVRNKNVDPKVQLRLKKDPPTANCKKIVKR
jgi:hypothetical protein